jgi:hypothetical protein
MWTIFAVLGTMTHHCGYDWPWMWYVDHQPNFHDYHHEKFNVNFGKRNNKGERGWCGLESAGDGFLLMGMSSLIVLLFCFYFSWFQV